MADVDRAMDAVLPFNQDVCLMQATASYPCAWEELDLAVINAYVVRYPGVVVGLSSHVAGISDGPPAYVLGARVFEKHITLNRASKGTDHAFSLEPNGLRRYVRDLRRCEVMMGDGRKRKHDSEAGPIAKMAASLYANKALRAGHVLSVEDVCIKSPAEGIAPYDFKKVIGMELVADLEEEAPLEWGLLHEHAAEEQRTV